MNGYIEKLKRYLSDRKFEDDCEDGKFLVDILYSYYIEDHPIESEYIKSRYGHLDAILSKLTLRENDEIFKITVDLCDEHTKLAFLNGVDVGFRLFTELKQ